MRQDYLIELMRAKTSIFTTNDVALLWGEPDVQFVRKKLHRYVKAGKLLSLRKGIYAKGNDYNRDELAIKILTPAYISFETILGRAGLIFQFYSQIFVASYLTREITVEGQTYAFRRMKESILTNRAGIEVKGDCFIASTERAFLDILYLNKDYHFDNLSSINWEKVETILPIYGGNKRMGRVVAEKHKVATSE
jgi:predicted transcriptional regulator of viral defense system